MKTSVFLLMALVTVTASARNKPDFTKRVPASDLTFTQIQGSKNSAPLKPYVGFVEIVGTPDISGEQFKKLITPKLENCILYAKPSIKGCNELQKELFDKLKAQYGWADLGWTFLPNIVSSDPFTNVFVDVVMQKEKALRLNLKPEPTGTFVDKNGTLASWVNYEKTAMDLVRHREIQMDKEEPMSQDCPALQCPYGHSHPKLLKFRNIFIEASKQHFDWLATVAREDKDFNHRSAAIQILAYSKNAEAVMGLLTERVSDSNEVVRSNALRIIGDVTEIKPDLIKNEMFAPVVAALLYPRVGDRMKAAYSISLWVKKYPEVKALLTPKHLEYLVMMLASLQPENQEFAYMILKAVAPEDFGKTNIPAWKAWALKKA